MLKRISLCLFLLVSTGLLFAQSAQVSGYVKDQTGANVPNASVELRNQSTGIRQSTVTNKEGIYSVPYLVPGTYVATVQAKGFRTLTQQGVVLHVGDRVGLNFSLKVGSANEAITVTAGPGNINTESASVSTVVDRQFVENMPLNGRSFQSLILLTPGVVGVPNAFNGGQGEFSVNGQRTESNYYTVDGVSATVGQDHPWEAGGTPAMTTLGTTQSMVSLDDLQEFRINTSTYSAEYGRSPGAQISFETRSGANTWHGSAFEYFRNDVLDANNWFNDRAKLPKPAERQNDFGGTMGGPVRIPGLYNGKDKTFFFFSYEGMRLTIPQPALTATVPDLALRQNAPAVIQPFLNAFPIPNGPDQGNGTALFTSSFSTPSNMDAYSIRLDHSFGDKLRVFGRYADTPSNSANRHLATLNNDIGGVKSVTIGTTSLFSPRLANEFRFNYTNNSTVFVSSQDNYGGATPFTLAQAMPGITVPPATLFVSEFLFGTGMYSEVANTVSSEKQWNITDSMTSVLGSHTLKYGIDYRRQIGTGNSEQLANEYIYSSASAVLTNSVEEAIVLSAGATPTIGYFTNFSAFVQDEWKTTNRLHLSLGLRWDVNPAPTSNRRTPALDQIANLATANVAPAGTPLYPTDYRGLAPRIGAVYQLRQNPGHETVIRGGFGVFYDTGSANALYGTSSGYLAENIYRNVTFPLTPAQQVLPALANFAPPYGNIQTTDPHLRLPYTREWNAAIEQQLGNNQTLTLSYVASGWRKLLQSYVDRLTNNPNFQNGADLSLVANRSTSDYNSLQAQFQRRLSHGLQVLASYTWSHSIDDLSTNGSWSAANGTESTLLRGNSSFDVRNNFSAALTYNVPGSYANSFAGAILKHWSIDLRQTARSALPVDINYRYTALPDGQLAYTRPNLVPGVPLYVSDPAAPGGRCATKLCTRLCGVANRRGPPA